MKPKSKPKKIICLKHDNNINFFTMRRDCLKLKLSDPHSVSVSSFHSESEDESSDRGSRSSRSGDDANMIPAAISAAQVSILNR